MKLTASLVTGLVMGAQALVIGGAVAAYYNFSNGFYVTYFTVYFMLIFVGAFYWLAKSETCHRLWRLMMEERRIWVKLGCVTMLLAYLAVAAVLWWLVCGFIIVHRATSSKKAELRAAA